MRNHSPWRRAWDRLYAVLTPGAWPARLAWTWGAHRGIAIERQTVVISHCAARRETLRVAFASDFHAGPATPWPLIENGVEAVRGLRPHLLLLGGDFVSVNPHDAERLAPLLGSIDAPLGRYAVLGNHDYWAGARIVETHLRGAGIEMLTNRSVTLLATLQRRSL